MSNTCQWFLLCENEATTTRPAPNLKVITDPDEPDVIDVPCCERCAAKVDRLEAMT